MKNEILQSREFSELKKMEKIIDDNLQAFYHVGLALFTIQQKKLYRTTHATFQEYVSERFKLSRSYAYRLIYASSAFNNIKRVLPIGDKLLPSNESVLRPIAKLDPDKQQKIYTKAVEYSGGKPPTAKEILHAKYEVNRAESFKKLKELSSIGKFSILYIDPPWKYNYCRNKQKQIENYYPTMTSEELKSLKSDIDLIALKNCTVFLWSPATKLNEAIELLNHWEFNYKTCMVWQKSNQYIGNYCKVNHELLLIAGRGKMPCPSPENRPYSIQISKHTGHSRKPDLFYDLLDKMYPNLKKIELFSRCKRRGWESWGNEV